MARKIHKGSQRSRVKSLLAEEGRRTAMGAVAYIIRL
jgi:hypothetical protein